jgi:hypothetical protein
MDAQASALGNISKAYTESFSDTEPLRVAVNQGTAGSSPEFSYSTGVSNVGPVRGIFTDAELDQQSADSLDDPNVVLPFNQYNDAKEAAKRLGRDSFTYQAPKALGGLLQLATGAAKEIRDNVGMEAFMGGPGAVVRKLGPSLYEGVLRKGPVTSVGFWNGVGNKLDNFFNAKQAQIDAANELSSTGSLTGTPEEQQNLIEDRAAQLSVERGNSPEDLKLREWQNYAFHKGIDQELINPNLTKLPGQDLMPAPLPNVSDVASMFSPTPENLAMMAAGELGGPLLGTAVKATGGRALLAIAEGGMKLDQGLIDAGAAIGRKIEDITGFAPETLKKAGDFVAGAGGLSAVGGAVGAVDPEFSKAAAEAALAYGLLRKGAAIIRVGSKAAGNAGVFFREAADPMGPLRAETIRSLAADPSIPEAYRAGMLSTASAIDSTPKRVAANPDLPDNVRKFAQTLSNPAIVAGVRGAGALAEGATAGTLSMTPLMMAASDDESPASLAITGAAMGAAGRSLGMIGSRTRQVNADIGRFLVDTHLAGGNVERTSALPRTRLEPMAAMQGFLGRKGVDLIPLSGQEYSANIMALGGTPGSAGFHLETPTDGGRPRLLVNLDAKAASEGHEFAHALAASNVLGGRVRADIFNWVNQSYGTDGVLARGREYVKRQIESEDRAYEAQYPTGQAPIRSLPDMESRISMRVDDLGQQSLKEGSADPLDWARNEIWAEQLSNGGLDLNKIRRGTPLGIDPAAMGESILGGVSRVLRGLGVAIDDQTGKVQGSLSKIFQENPLIGNSPKLRKTLANYVEAYDRWLPGVTEESTKSAPGIRVAPTGNITDFINSPLTKLHETRPGVRENEFIIEENGVPRFKTQAEINADAKAKEAQVGMLYTPGRLLPRDSSEFGPRKIDGRIVVGGPTLPAQFDSLVHFSPYLRQSARAMEANRGPGGPGSSFNVIYHRIGTSESGTFKVINRGNTEAVMREIVPFGWRVSNANKILANVLDMTALRGSVIKALNEGKMGIFNHNLDQFSADLKTYFDNHSKGLAGENRIGVAKKNAIDSFLFAGGTKANRAANPVYGDFGTRGTIRTLRLDRIQSIEPTGRSGLHFDYDKVNHNLMPDLAEAPRGQAMPDVGDTKGKDVFARSLEDIKASIPAQERWIGTKLPGQPVRANDGRRFLEHDLDTKTGPMNVTQPALDKAWADAIRDTGPAAVRALEELQKKGYTMKPPGEAHWKAAENLPNKDRLWYEISAEAMKESFPDFSKTELGKTMDVVAATSPLADPNYNARLAISILAEDHQGVPSVTPAVVQTSVKDALLGEFGKAEQRKVGSFGGTFRFLEGMSDDPPLTTNDRQVAASMGIPDSAFGTYPVLYELQSRFVNNLRDHINANGGMNSPFGPFQSHQLQALSWVQQRAEQRLDRRTNITDEEAFNGDAYASAFKLAANDLREAGVDVPSDPATGLPRFTSKVLSDPRVQQILTPPGAEFLKSTIQTMEMNTKMREVGAAFSKAWDESKDLGITPNVKVAEATLQRVAKALTNRTQVGDKKMPSPLSKLASAFGDPKSDISRIEFGRGTFKSDVSPNVRIPLDEVPEKYRPAFLSILGKHFHQEAQGASRFISVDPVSAGSHSLWLQGRGTMDGLEGLAKDLSEAGHEANISQRPNGVVIDVHPKFTDQGPVSIDPQVLRDIGEDAFGVGNSSVIPREYRSIYLEKSEYDSTILKARKELLNEHANQLVERTGIKPAEAKAFIRGDKAQLDSGKVSDNSRANKIRDSYRQRIDQLQSSEKELRVLFRNFEKDARKATGEMQKRIDSYHRKASKS